MTFDQLVIRRMLLNPPINRNFTRDPFFHRRRFDLLQVFPGLQITPLQVQRVVTSLMQPNKLAAVYGKFCIA